MINKIDKRVTHGMRNTRFYKIFFQIKQRCYNKNNPAFYRYGGKQIICKWKFFEQFKQDMYKSYLLHIKKYGEKETTIDRIDSSGNYCKENCRWASYLIQGNNTLRNIKIKFKNKEYTSLSCLARKLDISISLLRFRLNRKWSIKQLSIKPSLGRNKI